MLLQAADFPYSLLGLGDVAVPGLLACLALR
jgi:minor histocompatibility antigen H13